MLNEYDVCIHIIGVNTEYLFLADGDVTVLLALNEHDLHRMLNIATKFSNKWQLIFNYKKSNVLDTVKHIKDNKLGQLGINHIFEVHS